MLKGITYLIFGIIFGITMSKSEAISWYRIYEMFQFDSFHMYGIIGTAVAIGAIGIMLFRKLGIKTITGERLPLNPKEMSIPRYLIGGSIFGMGWALTGACPGPLFTLIGYEYWPVLIVLASAILGTLAYGYARPKLPH